MIKIDHQRMNVSVDSRLEIFRQESCKDLRGVKDANPIQAIRSDEVNLKRIRRKISVLGIETFIIIIYIKMADYAHPSFK